MAVEEGEHSIVVVDLLQVVETQGVTGQAAVGPLEVELEAALQISQWVARAGTLAAGLSGDGDVGDSVDINPPAPWRNIIVLSQSVSQVLPVILAGHFSLTVLVRLTARLTLESIHVAVLTVGVVLVTNTVSSLTRPLSIALALLHTLLLLTDETLLERNSQGELTSSPPPHHNLTQLTGQSVSRQHSGLLQVFEREQVLQTMLVRSGQSWSLQH